MKRLKSRCRKKRCKYSLHFSGREGNIVDMQPKTRKDNRRIEGAIAHHEYEEVGEKNIIHSIQNPKTKPKNQKVRKFKLRKWTRRITVSILSLSNQYLTQVVVTEVHQGLVADREVCWKEVI